MSEAAGFGTFTNSVLLLIISAILAFAAAWFWFSRNTAIEKAKVLAVDHAAVLSRLSFAEAQLARIDQVVVPINTMMQAMLVRELTHYHTPEMDELMKKIGPPSLLSEEETKRLIVLLEERTKDMGPLISASERGAATILPVIMERAKAEQDQIGYAESTKTQLVSVVSIVAVPIPSTSDKP
jgi:hypothetical protein